MKAIYTRCAIGLVLLLALGHAAFGVSIDYISFSQADWYDTNGVLLSENSVWGRMDMDVHADPTDIYYLNVTASIPGISGPWII